MIRACFITLLLLAAGLNGQDRKERATIDLRGLQATLSQDSDIQLELPLLSVFVDGLNIDCDGDSEDSQASADELVEIMRALGLVDLESDEDCWCGSESSIEVRASARNIARVRAFLETLARRFSRGATLELIEIDAAAVADRNSPRLSSNELADLLREHPARNRGFHRIRLGRREKISSARGTTVLGSYSVEVAEKSSMADPETRTLFEGEEASVWVAPRFDGRFRIDLALRGAERRGEMRRIEDVSDEIGMLELPRSSARIFRCSTDLAAGEALIFGATSESGTMRILHLREVEAELQLPDGLEILPVEHLTRSLQRSRMPIIPRAGINTTDDGRWSDGEECEPLPPMEIDRLHEIVAERAMQLGAEEGEIEGHLIYMAGDLWILGPKLLRDRARKILAEVSAPFERTIDCELRWDVLDREAVDALMNGGDVATAAKLGHRMLLSTRVGDPTVGLNGEEWTYVREKDVEIASDSRIISPVVDGLFAGFACRLVPTVIDDTRVFVDAEIIFQAPAARGDEIDSGRGEIGSIDRESIVRIETRPRLSLKSGAWQLLGVSPIAGSDRSLVTMAILR